MSTLQDRLQQLRALTAEAVSLGVDVPPTGQQRDHIDIAVVGEIKRGKSTFLNALMRGKVFPSRAQVCTSAVTVLVDAPAPTITVRYREPVRRPDERLEVPEGSTAFDVMMSVVAKPVKRKDGIQGNPDAIDVDEVEIGFPNRFAVEGIRLVDTPGVNDPEVWREDITYRYLSRADAAIMLLDPQQPISKSEVAFLRDKVQARVKQQLLFVLNKADEVSPKDLEASLERIRRELKPWVAEPRIFTLAAKPALEAALAGAPVDERFTAFEHTLDAFLRRGRAGGLLANRVELLVEGISRKDASLSARLATLAQEQGNASGDLDRMERLLEEKGRSLQVLARSMRAWLESQTHQTIAELRKDIKQLRARIGSNPDGARAEMDQSCRDIATALEDASEALSNGLIERFGDQAEYEAGELRPARVKLAPLNLAHFDYRGSAGVNSTGAAAKGGFALGMLFGGPLGALVGGVLGGFIASTMDDQNKKLDEQRLVAAAQAHLTDLERTMRSRVGELAEAVAGQMIPHLCRPLRTAIEDETRRVAASRHDLAQSGAARATIHDSLNAERARLHAFSARCGDLQHALTLA
jgi:tRNA U34 5-carboxymethylaminomethyl modifying GTPase MnmE/TrmE